MRKIGVSTGSIFAGVKRQGVLDRIEQVLALVLVMFFIYRLWPDSLTTASMYLISIIISECIVVAFLLFRRPTTDVSTRGRDWFVALAGTSLPLLITKGGESFMPVAGVILLVTGLGIHVGAKLSLRRSIGIVAANRGIKTGGAYEFVRHPMYLGYLLTHSGVLLAAPNVWNACIYVMTWAFLILRIFAEERILANDRRYSEYMKRVRYRVVPGLF